MNHPLLNFLNLWKNGQYANAINYLSFGNHSNLDPTEEIIKVWKETKINNSVQLASTGSSSIHKFYHFGPIDGILEIERLIKDRQLTMIQMHHGANDFYPIKNKKYQKLFAFNVDNPNFQKLWRTEGSLCACPNVWLFLSKQKNFLEELGNSKIRSISTTCWESFFDRSLYTIFINDNMLNLKTGDGFYTCPHNIHCLPFKLKIGNLVGNLLNLGDKTLHADDDDIKWEYKSCPCGSRLPIATEINCHTGNTFRTNFSLANKLQGQYSNFQLIKSQELNLFVSAYYPEDISLIQEIYGEIRIHIGKRYRTGINKWASFWSVNSLNPASIEEF